MLLTHTQLPAQKELSELLLEQLPLEIVLHVLQEKYAHKQDWLFLIRIVMRAFTAQLDLSSQELLSQHALELDAM
jgi:hypothetical protein